MSITEQIAHILITERTDDYHACVVGVPAVWACGPTRREAIGALVEAHPEWFTAPRSDHIATWPQGGYAWTERLAEECTRMEMEPR